MYTNENLPNPFQQLYDKMCSLERKVDVGEAAIGTARVMLLKDQLFDKDHRKQLQQQMSQLLKQQILIAQQLKEIKREMEEQRKWKVGSFWPEKPLM